MSVTIELAILHQRPETLEGLKSNETYNAQIDLLKKQKGVRAVRIGPAVDEGYKNDVHWIVEWDDKSDHETFMNDPSYKAFADALTGFCTGTPPLELHHIRTTPSRASSVLSARVVEVLTVKAGSGVDTEEFRTALDTFRDTLEAKTGRPALAEPTIEDARQFNLLIGWDSVEQHTAVTKEPWFKGELDKVQDRWAEPNLVHVELEHK